MLKFWGSDIMEDLDRAAKFNETISAAAGQERNFGIIAERTEVGWLRRRIYNFGGSGGNASAVLFLEEKFHCLLN